MTIRSPLGAMGAVVVLIQAISAAALFTIQSQFILQAILVGIIGLTTLVFVGLVFWLVVYLARREPALLFNPRDIDPSVHRAIYASRDDTIEVKVEKDNSGKFVASS